MAIKGPEIGGVIEYEPMEGGFFLDPTYRLTYKLLARRTIPLRSIAR